MFNLSFINIKQNWLQHKAELEEEHRKEYLRRKGIIDNIINERTALGLHVPIHTGDQNNE